MTHSLIFLFSFNCCEFVVLYIILLEVARELSRFCKMAHRTKVVGPRWLNLLLALSSQLSVFLKLCIINTLSHFLLR